ncbi:hypothetical protein PMIN03_001804 [Paraphaeosphaeria minitans]
MAAAKRKAPKKKAAKTARNRRPRDSKTPSKKAPTAAPAPGNANTPLLDHPYAHLPFSTRRSLDATNHGFNHIKPAPAPLTLHLRRLTRYIPDPHPALVPHLMQLMQNKLFLVRQYFLPEAKALMWAGADRGPRTASEKVVLEEFARGTGRGGAGVGVSYRAQDCVRLVLYYAALFAKEDGEGEGVAVEERGEDLRYRGIVWGWLREEIGGQLPGSKAVREGRAEVVMERVFGLTSAEVGGEGGA